jgi:2-oxoglutarate ferredoxin oxidoreductase subunit alpha
MNDWMVSDLEFDESKIPDRGKVLTAAQLEDIEKFYRYNDVDGDGIAARSLPGVHAKGSYFTRGSGHTRYGSYTEDSAAYQDVMDRLLVKWETARSSLPAAEIEYSKFNKAGILTVGSGHGACLEARDRLAAQKINLNYCRVRAFPFADTVPTPPASLWLYVRTSVEGESPSFTRPDSSKICRTPFPAMVRCSQISATLSHGHSATPG